MRWLPVVVLLGLILVAAVAARLGSFGSAPADKPSVSATPADEAARTAVGRPTR